MNLPHDPLVAEKIYNVLYCSHATALMTDDELARIIKTSGIYNLKRGVTGLLVYGGDIGLAVARRSKARGRIADDDPGHRCTARNHRAPAGARWPEGTAYPAWAMQNVAAGDLREIPPNCQSRAHHEGHARIIGPFIKLLETDQLAMPKPPPIGSIKPVAGWRAPCKRMFVTAHHAFDWINVVIFSRDRQSGRSDA